MSYSNAEYYHPYYAYRPFIYRPTSLYHKRHHCQEALTKHCEVSSSLPSPPPDPQYIAAAPQRQPRSLTLNNTNLRHHQQQENQIFFVPVVFHHTSRSFHALTPISARRFLDPYPCSTSLSNINNLHYRHLFLTRSNGVELYNPTVMRQSTDQRTAIYRHLDGNNMAHRRRTASATGADEPSAASTDSLAANWNNSAGMGASDTTVSSSGYDAASVDHPVRKKAYFCIILLFLVNLLNYMDRYTIAGILEDVQRYYSLDVKSLGLIQTVFICSYMVLAPIFGFLGDRYNRRLLLTFGIFMWSMTTFLGSLIPRDHFYGFLFLRAMVGIGEASYSTIAPTIIADMFAKKRRSKMLAFFYFAIPVGSGLGYIVGSSVAKWTGTWQYALRVTPVLGIILDVCIFMFLEDPPRGMADGGMSCHATDYRTDLKSLMRNKSFVFSTIAFTCCTFAAGGIAMFAPEFMRLAINQTRKMDASSVSLIFGVITCVAGFVGVAIGSLSSQRFRRISMRADPLICAFGMLSCTPFLFCALWLSRAEPMLTWFLIFTAEVFLCLNWPLVADILLYCVLPTRRGTAEAFQILVSHAFGDAGSPYLIGIIADALVSGEPNDTARWQAMQHALFITCFMTVVSGGFFLLASVYIEKDRMLVEYEINKAAALQAQASELQGNVAAGEAVVVGNDDELLGNAPSSAAVLPYSGDNTFSDSHQNRVASGGILSPPRRYSNYATFTNDNTRTTPPASPAHARAAAVSPIPNTPPPPYLPHLGFNNSNRFLSDAAKTTAAAAAPTLPTSVTQHTLLPLDSDDDEHGGSSLNKNSGSRKTTGAGPPSVAVDDVHLASPSRVLHQQQQQQQLRAAAVSNEHAFV